MIANTINDSVTMPGGDGALLANRYRIVRQLGQGGMGLVWLVEDTQLDSKQFAVKMLPSILVSNKRAYRQMKDEALVAMKLTHPNIVTLRAFEENNGNPFLVMDYIDGQSLDDCLEEWGTLSEGQTATLLRPVAAALDYAHRQGVVHRDIKPGNIMIRKDGVPFVLDFGIAREIQETMTRVTGKLSSGTLLYMSPEQLNGERPTSAQDVYSFAAMAYECIKGEQPFCRGAIEDQIKSRLPEPLPGKGAISEAVMAGLAKRPEDRPPTCMAVLGEGGPGRKWRRSGKVGESNAIGWRGVGALKWAIGVLAILVVLAGGSVWWWTHRTTPSLRGTSPSLTDDEELAKLNAQLRTDDEELAALNAGLSGKPTPQKPSLGASSASSITEGSGKSVEPPPEKPKSPTWEEKQAAINNCKWQVDLIRTGIASKVKAVEPFRAMKGDFSDIITKIDDDWKRLKGLPEPKTMEEAKSQPENASAIAKAIDEGIKALDKRRTFYINQSLENARKLKDSAFQDKWELCIAECEKVLGWDTNNFAATQLKAEAERHLVPSATIVAKIGSRVVADAKIEHEGKRYGLTFSDLRGRNTLGPYKIVYDENGKHYAGTLSKTLVWDIGHKDIPVALMPITRPRHKDTKTLILPGGETMEMIYVEPGSFMMGSPESEDGHQNNELQHRVTLTKGFWLGKCEVTQKQWQSVMKDNPSEFKSPDRPVENVSWEDCQKFIAKVNAEACRQLGGESRLPTEAEWEYACRAGTKGVYALRELEAFTMNHPDAKMAFNNAAWYRGNSDNQTHPVGEKGANAWGFHDIHGNVWEWCSDWYGGYPSGNVVDPQGPASGDARVLRGGGWSNFARDCRSAKRLMCSPGYRYYGISCGFRLCCSEGPR